ncbi:P21-Rho-binding domain-containing protein [Pilobolus umbonatus]|nr:P21-Rho-binding domain-containing protein [Pilobolus umbonatus]
MGTNLDFLSSNNHTVNYKGLQKEMDISTPYNTVHITHVGFDSATGGFTGVPAEWNTLLSQSGITKQEQKENPQAVIDALEYFQDAQKITSEHVWDKIPVLTIEESKPLSVEFSHLGISPSIEDNDLNDNVNTI